MAEKTNKSYSKRFKVTAGGKVLARKRGRNHYNAKKTRTTLQDRKGLREVELPNRVISNNLPHAGLK